jgi:hypothetical protein
MRLTSPSSQGAKRRSNPALLFALDGLLRSARNDEISISPNAENTPPPSRDAECARILQDFLPSEKTRARGMPGARCARSLAGQKKSLACIVTTVTTESPGIPRAMVLTVSFVLSAVNALGCHRRPANMA